MKEKNIKFIMELIFIFILPLLFILPNVSINNNYVYDNDGNFETSSKELIYSDIVFDTNYRNVILDFNIWDELTRIGVYDTTTGIYYSQYDQALCNINPINVVPNDNYYYCCPSNYGYLWVYYYDNDMNFLSYSTINPNSIFTIPNDVYYFNFNLRSQLGITIYSYNICFNKSVSWANGNYVSYGDDLIIYSDTDLSGQNDIVYSPFKYIKDLIGYALKIDTSNITFNLIIDYTCIWFIMFIIWHLFYCLFDFIIHLVRIRRKE